MPWRLEFKWEPPSVAIDYHGVVVHHCYHDYPDEDFSCPVTFMFGIYKPVREDDSRGLSFGSKVFVIDEGEAPLAIFDLRELAPLVGMEATKWRETNCNGRPLRIEAPADFTPILRALIDAGIIDQTGGHLEGVPDPDQAVLL